MDWDYPEESMNCSLKKNKKALIIIQVAFRNWDIIPGD